ncbi:MAG: tetratricopeptide repeat protein [Sphingomonas bacterium]|nr:tetratricopeptide repeat protein [Sphingomonas bacterium]
MRNILALSPDSSETFLREVDEELRRDQAQAFAKRYATMIAGAVLLFLAAIGGWLYWQDRQSKIAAADSETLTAAMDNIAAKRTATIGPALDQLINSPSEGIATEARLAQASVALAGGNRASAIAIYRSVADDKGLAQPFRDLASMRLVTLEFDSIKPEVAIARLEPLAKPGNPWFGSAGELTAMAMLKQGRKAEAGRLFAAVAADNDVPDTIRSRAVQIAGTLGVDATASLPGITR